MYLNLLLKKKKGPTHNFSFDGSTDIKTDKEHIHKGFKDHKGLSYSFNGPTKPTTDNKLVYRGFTKNYDGPHFHHTTNDTEYLKNFNLNPKTQPVELYTAYKNKYPKLSPNEYSIQTWQTEKGQPNELNRFMRQDKTGRSIEQIEIDDKDYLNGLQILEDHIRRTPKTINKIKEDETLTEKEKENEIQTLKIGESVAKRIYKKINPVLIKPALRKFERYDVEKRSHSEYNKIDKALNKLGKHLNKSNGVEEKNASEGKSTKEKRENENNAEPTTPTKAKKEQKIATSPTISVDDASTEPIKYNQKQEDRILAQGRFNKALEAVEPGKTKLSDLPESVANEIVRLKTTLGIPARTIYINSLKNYVQSVPSSVMSNIGGKAQDILKQATKGKSKSVEK